MLKMVDGTGIIGVDMICPLGVSTPQPPNYDRVELEGTGMLVLPNSLDAPLERLELGGKTEQVQTSGKNLFNREKAKDESNWKHISGYQNYPIYVGTGNKVTFSYLEKLNTGLPLYFGVGFKESSISEYMYHATTPSLIANKKTLTATGDYAYLIVSESNVPAFLDAIQTFQVEISPTQTSYEPYTGGKPSPSPEYPQEIKNSGKWNEDKQKYEVDAKFTGKNLFDKDKVTSENPFGESYRYVPIYIGKGTKTVTVQYSKKLSDGLGFYTCISRVAGSTTQIFGWLYHSGSSSLAHNLLQFQANQDTVYLSYAGNINALKNELCQYLQVEISDTQTPYQPYKEQTLTITSDRPITKWDRLVEQGGEIGWLYKHRVVNDLSALVKDSEPIYGKDGGKYFSVSLQGALFNYDYNKIYSVAGLSTKDSKIHYVPKPMMQNVIIYVSDTDTIMTAKEHMHYKVIYETIESQFAPLPQSEQNAIRALKTYYPTTVITADGGELDPDIKVTYRKEK